MTSSSVSGRFSRLPRVAERARLLEPLQGALNFRLTLITAPPGYGKTTVVAQFAEWSPVLVI